MNALQAAGLALILILTGMAMAISIAVWPLGVAIVLAGLAVLFVGRCFGGTEESKPPPFPAEKR